jgi:hypothetical protein
MTLYGASLIFAFLFLGVIYALVARKVWRGESGLDGSVPPEWWFLGDATWRGVARAYIATGPFGLLLLAGGMVAEFTDAYDAGMAIAVGALLLGALVHGSIVLFNRPRALVPPLLRDEPGALAERRQRRARLARR